MTRDIPRLVGMVHLLPLPGSPRFGGSINEVVSTAADDARILVDAGFPALMVENFGDVPFYADATPPETVAAMSVAVKEIAAAGVTFGVNVLRNDVVSALAIAAATGASLVRANVLSGLMYTDQGPIVGRAAEVMRKREALCPRVEVWADVLVKHAIPPSGLEVRQATQDLVERGLADAVIVSGSGTGAGPEVVRLKEVREAVPDGTRVVVGSGATPENLGALCEFADTVIVGSHLKVEGNAGNRPDPKRASDLVRRAGERGLL